MKKTIFTLVLIVVSSLTFAQNENAKHEKVGDMVEATYYHENGEIMQHGYFNAEGELHGTWKSYDSNGKKLAVATYNNGEKVGKWFFWNDNSLKEVDFLNSKIVSVNEWNNKKIVAIRD